jgi:crotonobetainyl-CoA:carnitine CoA-transferase CaiB-like acyl-CoA transferase
VIETWLASVPTRQEAVDRLVAAGVVAAPVLTPEEAVAHPLYVDRGMIVEAAHPALGSVPMIRAPYRFSNAGITTERGPALGEHNEAVLSELLDVTPEGLSDLYDSGVLHRGPALDVPAEAVWRP